MSASKIEVQDFMGNGQSNNTQVILPGLTLYFSYSTVIAFYTPDTGRIVSENIWSTTTGKHINNLKNGATRIKVNRAEFENMLSKISVTVNV